jgi:hypothetical protein
MPSTAPPPEIKKQMPQAPPPLPLRDIIAPLEQGWWPPAPGWWLVAAIALFLVGWLVKVLVKFFTYEYSALRKAALRELANLPQQEGINDRHFAEQISALLKRVAIVRYTEQQPARLNGEDWLAFLDQSDSSQIFSQSGGRALLEVQYQASASLNRNELLDAARAWIKAI